MNAIWQTVLAIIGSIGGAGVIICAIIKFASDKIADRLSAKYKLQLDKELETFKQDLDRKNYVSKVRFDVEFAIYRELTVACRGMVNNVYFVYPTYANIPADKDARENYEQEVYDKATKSLTEFNKLLHGNAPFIPKSFYDSFFEVSKLCKQNIDVYAYRWNRGYIGIWEESKDKRDAELEAYQRTGEFTKKFDALIDDIRNYLAKLDVYE